MSNETLQSNFHHCVSELVLYHLSSNPDITIQNLADYIGISESFLKKALYSKKHFNAFHLFLISQKLKISLDDLMPTEKNLRMLGDKTLTPVNFSSLCRRKK